MIASRIPRLSVILTFPLWQTLSVGQAFAESAMDQSVTSGNRWYLDGIVAKSNRPTAEVVLIWWRFGAGCGLLKNFFQKSR